MSYVDGYVLAIPAANRERFRAMAARIGDRAPEETETTGATALTHIWSRP